jgi:hypothetical protein
MADDINTLQQRLNDPNSVLNQISKPAPPPPPSTMDKLKTAVGGAVDATTNAASDFLEWGKGKFGIKPKPVDPQNMLQGFGMGEVGGKKLIDRNDQRIKQAVGEQ